MIEVVTDKLLALLETNNLPFQHCAIRLTEALAVKYLDWLSQQAPGILAFHYQAQQLDVRENESNQTHPLLTLQSRLLSLLGNSRNFVKLKILQALIWVFHHAAAGELEDRIMSEIVFLPLEMFDGISLSVTPPHRFRSFRIFHETCTGYAKHGHERLASPRPYISNSAI